MSKTKDAKKIGELTEDHRPLADSELDEVSGGLIADYVKQLLANSEPKGNGSGSWFDALATALGQAMNSRL